MKCWPAHPQPLQDELFSSWIYRAARANGQKFFSLCYLVAPELRNIHHNYDYVINENALRRFSLKLRTPYQRAFQTTLDSYAGYLYESASTSRNRKSSILYTGIQSKAKRRFSLQVCPICLSEGEAYFRKKWRITFITVCSIHGCKLLDRCPKCSHPIRPIQNDIGNQKMLYKGEITRCCICNFDLKTAETDAAEQSLLSETKWYEKILRNGYVLLGHSHYVYSFSFFNVLRHLIGIVTFKSGPKKNNNLKPDILPLDARYSAIQKLAGSFTKWPVNFIERCERLKFFYSDFTCISKGKNTVPFWLDTYIKSAIYFPNLHPTEESVRAAIRQMQKRDLKLSVLQLNKFMGYCDSNVVKKIYKQEITYE